VIVIEAPVEEYGANSGTVFDVLARAARLTPAEAARLADAVSWNWWPLTVPPGGTIATAWATAGAAAHRAGRDSQVAAATEAGRAAVRHSAGFRAASRRGSRADLGLALLAVGFVALILPWAIGRVELGWLGLLVMLGGVVVLAFAEGGLVARGRLLRGVTGAVTAAVLQDVLEPEAFETLNGPWRAALRD
jgi:hypothetical protein